MADEQQAAAPIDDTQVVETNEREDVGWGEPPAVNNLDPTIHERIQNVENWRLNVTPSEFTNTIEQARSQEHVEYDLESESEAPLLTQLKELSKWRPTLPTITKSTLFQLFLLLGLAILAGVVFATNYLGPNNYPTDHKLRTFSDFKISNSTDHISSILQISDLHLSSFRDRRRTVRFGEFLGLLNDAQPDLSPHERLDRLKPLDMVMVTGDMTDGRGENYVQGRQIETEWIAYNQSVVQSKILESGIKMVDLRGNHDVYGSLESKFFEKYSVTKLHTTVTTLPDHSDDSTCYDFVPLDAAPLPGTGRPLDFIGYFQDRDMIENYDATRCNLSIFYGHYPLSTVYGFRIKTTIAQKAAVYLSGHLHESAIPKIREMYAMHRFHEVPLAEFELGDWRDNRRVRIITLDQGLFNFVDFEHGDDVDQSMVMSVTNPKPRTRYLAASEPLDRIQYSDHIRIFVYLFNVTTHCHDTLNVTAVNSITGGGNHSHQIVQNVDFILTQNLTNSVGLFTRLLFTAPWQPEYDMLNMRVVSECAVNDTVTLKVSEAIEWNYAKDADNFSSTLNGHVSLFAKLILLTNAPAIGMLIFYMGCLIGLGHLYRLNHWFKTTEHRMVLWSWKLLIVAGFWLIIGPWWCGNMVDTRLIARLDPNHPDAYIEETDPNGHKTYGIMFTWGVVLFNVGKQSIFYAQDHTTYMLGAFIAFTFYLPCIFLVHLYSSHMIYATRIVGPARAARYRQLMDNESVEDVPQSETVTTETWTRPNTRYNLRYVFLFLVPFSVFSYFQMLNLYTAVLAYGGLILLLAPIPWFVGAWPIVLLAHGTHVYWHNKYYMPLALQTIPSRHSSRSTLFTQPGTGSQIRRRDDHRDELLLNHEDGGSLCPLRPPGPPPLSTTQYAVDDDSMLNSSGIGIGNDEQLISR